MFIANRFEEDMNFVPDPTFEPNVALGRRIETILEIVNLIRDERSKALMVLSSRAPWWLESNG